MKTIIITGMPRSGTSWLGQIVNSDPSVAFRMEPLFAYRFKNRINATSSCEEVNELFASLVDLDDEFMLQKENQRAGYYPTFEKRDAEIVAVKTTRHHELLERYLECLSDVHIVGIVRHPAGAINSWMKSYKEFEKKGCSLARDWRTGDCRKQGIGEYWGFDDWLSVTKKFVRLAAEYSNFHLIRYSDLVKKTDHCVKALFQDLGMEMQPQTASFISACHSRHDKDPYSVFKNKVVADEWMGELDPGLAKVIVNEATSAGLSYFLE